MSAPGWDNFWKDQKRSFYAVMKIATRYFTTQLIQKQFIKPGQAILDYGCGPGFVVDGLATSNVSITGVDINAFFIAECRKNHPSHTFIHTKDLHDRLDAEKFDRIIMLSVAQYLKSTTELKDIMQWMLLHLKSDGQIIIADVIDDRTSSVKDAWTLFVYCIKKGKIAAFTGFVAYLLFSDYRKISQKTQLLKVPPAAIIEIADSLDLNFTEVPGLTLHPTRRNYLFTRPSL